MTELNFTQEIDKSSVLRHMKLSQGDILYDSLAERLEELTLRYPAEVSIYIDAVTGDMIYVLITCGEVSNMPGKLIDDGEILDGYILDALLTEYLFAADEYAGLYIKSACAVKKKGIEKRMEVPDTLPPQMQKTIAEHFPQSGVTVTSAMMLIPEKAMCYALKLTDDKNVFKAQHDCSACPHTDCPMRSNAYGSMKVISGYESFGMQEPQEDVICVDIGTTTVAMQYLTNDGKKYACTFINPQRRFGADVISRIAAANAGRLTELRSLIRFRVADGIRKLIEAAGRRPSLVIIAANTAMTYMFLGKSCVCLSEFPFETEKKVTFETNFAEIPDLAEIPIKLIGGISAFVGGDIVSGSYLCGVGKSSQWDLFIDLGTNGEIVLAGDNKIFVTSVAAGPAFEGGKIKCGIGSVEGAVCTYGGETKKIITIGNKAPVGICGSGIIDIVSYLLGSGLMDKTGLLCDKYFDSGFSVCDDIVFTQNDIREVQSAKSAVRTGIEILISRAGIKYEDIGRFFIAGGMGQSLDPESACNIGIFPAELKEKTIAVGDSSLGGCAKCAGDKNYYDELRHISEISTEITLANDSAFNDMFLRNMDFTDQKKLSAEVKK